MLDTKGNVGYKPSRKTMKDTQKDIVGYRSKIFDTDHTERQRTAQMKNGGHTKAMLDMGN